MKNGLLLSVVAAAALLSSCKPNVLVGRGEKGDENRTVSGFSRVTVNVPLTADIKVDPAAAASFQLSGYKNIIARIRSEVANGTLRIYLPEGSVLETDNEIRATITMPSLAGLEINGSADAHITGPVSGSKLDLDISGTGDVAIDNVQLQQLDADISGAGSLALKGGTIVKAGYDISGTGSVDAPDVVTQEVETSVSGSGEVTVNAVARLDASVSGTGDVRYKGAPQVQSEISGTGSVEAMK